MTQIIKIERCRLCMQYANDPIFRNPAHLVHPVDNVRMLFDVRSEAVCPVCRSRWRRHRNEAVLVE